MSSDTLEIFIAAYDTEGGAAAALKDFKAAEREGAIDLIDGAVVVHTADGKVKYDETADPSTRRWTKRGVVAGGVVGLIFPPSLIASAIVGAGAGGIWGKVRDKGFADDQLARGRREPPRGLLGDHRGRAGPRRRAARERPARLRAHREAGRLRRGRRHDPGRGAGRDGGHARLEIASGAGRFASGPAARS